MKAEDKSGKMSVDVMEQNHPPNARSGNQETAGSVSGKRGAPNAPSK